MAPSVRDLLNGYLESGAVTLMAGRLTATLSRDNGAEVRVRLKNGREQTLTVNRIISCTGIREDYANSTRPLVRSLIENGVASANDLGIGLRADSHGALLNARSLASSVFFTLGRPRQGELFETTSVPDIRVQAEALAFHLMKSGNEADDSAREANAQPEGQRQNRGDSRAAGNRNVPSVDDAAMQKE